MISALEYFSSPFSNLISAFNHPRFRNRTQSVIKCLLEPKGLNYFHCNFTALSPLTFSPHMIFNSAASQAHDKCIRISPLNWWEYFFLVVSQSERKSFTVELKYTQTYNHRRAFHCSLTTTFELKENSKWWSMISFFVCNEISLMSSYFIVWKNWFPSFATESSPETFNFTFHSKFPSKLPWKSSGALNRLSFSATQQEIKRNLFLSRSCYQKRLDTAHVWWGDVKALGKWA